MEALRLLDIKIFYLLNQTSSNPYFAYLMAYLTELGSVLFVFAVGLIFLFSKRKEKKLLGIFIFAGSFISYELISFLKALFEVPRPSWALADVYTVIQVGSYAFPSGHSCFAFMLATILAVKIQRKILLYTLAIIVALSRVFLGVHYPSDVIVGSLIGLIIGLLLARLYNYLECK